MSLDERLLLDALDGMLRSQAICAQIDPIVERATRKLASDPRSLSPPRGLVPHRCSLRWSRRPDDPEVGKGVRLGFRYRFLNLVWPARSPEGRFQR
jgi:hypothetical protein